MIYVSAERGNDSNPGTLAAPLREIATATAQSPAGETVVVLDSGDYAKFSVTKSLTVAADGVYAEVSAAAAAFGNTAVTVSAGAADVVVLRGLSIKGTGGTVGVSFSSGKTLHVENCTISNFVSGAGGFPSRGIEAYSGVLSVKSTILRDNTSGLSFSSGSAKGIIDRCRIEGNGLPNAMGVYLAAGAQVTMTGSVVTGHADQGIYLRGLTGSPVALLSVIESVITHNRIGIYADKLSQVHLVHSTVTLNGTGLFTLNAGVIYTSGNNSVIGNLLANFGGGGNVLFFKSDITS